METDREKHGLRGPVKTVHTRTARFEEEGGRLTEKFWHAHTLSFDAGGNLTEEIYETPTARPSGQCTFTATLAGEAM